MDWHLCHPREVAQLLPPWHERRQECSITQHSSAACRPSPHSGWHLTYQLCGFRLEEPSPQWLKELNPRRDKACMRIKLEQVWGPRSGTGRACNPRRGNLASKGLETQSAGFLEEKGRRGQGVPNSWEDEGRGSVTWGNHCWWAWDGRDRQDSLPHALPQPFPAQVSAPLHK